MIKKIISFIYLFFFSILYSQGLISEYSKQELLEIEYNSINKRIITEEMFYLPYVQKTPSKKKHINVVKRLDYKSYFVLEPVFAIRYSSKGFNMYSNNQLSLKPVTWISPGIKIHSTIPLLNSFSNLWVYSWANFYKHSAYGFSNNETIVDSKIPLSYFDVYNSFEFYEPTKSPNNGIDFDEGQAGVSLISQNFQFIIGKYRTKIGPFYRSNLSISDNAPSFEQFMFKVNYDKKIFFSYLIGSVSSNIPKFLKYGGSVTNHNLAIDEIYTNQWELDNDLVVFLLDSIYTLKSVPFYDRYIVNHRIDFKLLDNLRIGLYEQIIFGTKSPPISYLIPINPFWSSQHSDNDQDNLQMGFDFEYIFSKYRFYGAFLMDEWALFDTFKDNERNWFAYQLGLTRIFKLFNMKSLLKFEYSKIDPRVYHHRFMINESKHHGYNIGFWSGSNSDDLYSNITVFINDNNFFKIDVSYTRFGKQDKLDILEKQYNNLPVSFLNNNYLYLKTFALSYLVTLKYNIDLGVDFTYSKTDVYQNRLIKYNDYKISFRYNIKN